MKNHRTKIRLTSSCHAIAIAIVLVAISSTGFAFGQIPTHGSPLDRRNSSSCKGSALWWKHAVNYEIYPRSFEDTNGDGTGDLKGITNHLDYLQWLGVDAIWIAPMYPSPQVDFGYDISDYECVDSQYGTLADLDQLQTEAKKRNIRICLDMVLNHTSDKHRWFLESSRSRTNPKSDWYVWNSGIPADTPGVTDYQKRYGHEGMVPPNNWTSLFGGSAWQWVPARKQFYYHKFYVQQPDLNWRNPAVEAAMFGVMKFWLDRGIAGFRLDAIPELFEDPQLRDEPVVGDQPLNGDPQVKDIYTSNLPEVHGVLRRMRKLVDSYPGDRVLIGETYFPTTAELDNWYGGAAHDELQLPMDMLIGFGPESKLNAPHFRRYINEIETQVHGSQPLVVFDNHDQIRSIDRFGDGVHNVQIAKLIATILFTMRATPLTYYGAPLGMTTTDPKRIEDVKDPIGITGWPKDKGRDGERTPMQWNSQPQAGFSSNPDTWLPIPPSYKTINVASERADKSSLLNWYHTLISVRRSSPALLDGDFVMLGHDDPNFPTYLRKAPHGEGSVLIAINMSAQTQTLSIDDQEIGIDRKWARTLASTSALLSGSVRLSSVRLPPFTAWIAEVERN
jgi:alpha-glucosidase